MDIVNWLERQGYASNYPGEWIVLSGQTTAIEVGRNAHKLESHGRQRKDVMKTIRLMLKSTPKLWTVAIKVPDKPYQPSEETQ